ncbi:MAG: ChbG/HpnK family deacetylase [Curvibacter sp.]|nr:ChbG/HpnK family deacetylase [Curvibacter sp.]
MKSLVLCADDFALHAPASQGIVALAEAGRLSATSVMTLSPRWAQDAPALASLRDRLDVGLHLDWTSDFAIAAGHGAPLGAVMRRAALSGHEVAAAARCIEAQLDAFEKVWGAAPDHVDGHQHVQQFAGIREALVQVLGRRYGPSRRPYLRVSRPVGWQGGLKGRVIAAMGAGRLQSLARAQGIPAARWLSGIDDFSGDAADYGRRMARWLSAAPDGTLLMCHPALADEPGDEIGAARLREWTYLRSPAFEQALAQAGAVLSRGRALYASTPSANKEAA